MSIVQAGNYGRGSDRRNEGARKVQKKPLWSLKNCQLYVQTATTTNSTWCHIPRYQKFMLGRKARPQIYHQCSPMHWSPKYITNHQNKPLPTNIHTNMNQYPPIPINQLCWAWRRAQLILTVSCMERNFQAASVASASHQLWGRGRWGRRWCRLNLRHHGHAFTFVSRHFNHDFFLLLRNTDIAGIISTVLIDFFFKIVSRIVDTESLRGLLGPNFCPISVAFVTFVGWNCQLWQRKLGYNCDWNLSLLKNIWVEIVVLYLYLWLCLSLPILAPTF